MKLVLAALVATTAATTAMAGTLNMDSRFDSSSKSYNTEAATKDHSTLGFKVLRLDYQGKVNEDIGFRTRVRLDKASEAKTTKDNLSAALDLAYLSHKMTDDVTAYFGKFGSEVGGFEGNLSSGELYLNSEAYSGKTATGATLGNTGIAGNADYLYVSGVKATGKMGNFSLSLMATDRVKSNTVGTSTEADTENTKIMTGAVVRGSFMEDSLKFIASFHMEDKDDNNKTNLMAAGVQYTIADVAMTFDYLMNTFKNSAKDDTVSSLVANVGYKMGAWTPALKFFQSDVKVKSATSKDSTGTGISAVLEYKPVSDANFRYHVAYNTLTTKGDLTANKSFTMTEVVAGVRWNADFLK